MIKIGLIKEGKTPRDTRVAFTPEQCKWIKENIKEVEVVVQSSKHRCYTDKEYKKAGIEVREQLDDMDILLGIKEVPVEMLLPGKTYLFFSHTIKKQKYNQELLQQIIKKNITLIDYELLTHDDGQRILGFGFFAGVVGAHNGLMAYGNRTGAYKMGRVFEQKSFEKLVHSYFGLKLPPFKIVVTGSGKVAHGIIEIMNHLDIVEVEPDEFVSEKFTYPVYTQLKHSTLYEHKETGKFNREDFRRNPQNYKCKFLPYISYTDILMNGIYWDSEIPRLFEREHINTPEFKIVTIADITDDKHGSVPCNLGDSTIDDPVYGVDRESGLKTAPYLPNSIDMMAVGNLPNELPRDASRFFGDQFINHILEPLVAAGSNKIIERATIVNNGALTEAYNYLSDFAAGKE